MASHFFGRSTPASLQLIGSLLFTVLSFPVSSCENTYVSAFEFNRLLSATTPLGMPQRIFRVSFQGFMCRVSLNMISLVLECISVWILNDAKSCFGLSTSAPSTVFANLQFIDSLLCVVLCFSIL